MQDETPVVDVGEQLSSYQKAGLRMLVSQYKDVFRELPGQTTIIQHKIHTAPGVLVRQQPYRVPEACQLALEQDVQRMLQLVII